MGICISSESIKTENIYEIKEVKIENDIYKDNTLENTPEYTLENCNRKVKILRVLDGDTVDIALYHDDMKKIYKYRVRLYGIDTPEKRPLKSNPNRDDEIKASIKSKNALQKIVNDNDSILLAKFYKRDKYGRELCTFYDKNGDDINKWMIQNGYAYEYFGKTKKIFEDNSNGRSNCNN